MAAEEPAPPPGISRGAAGAGIGFMLGGRPIVLYLTWLALVAAAFDGLISGRYSVSFVATGTLLLTFTPIFASRWLHIEPPTGFVSATAVFLYGTLFLGEVGQFYEKYWWWDIFLHVGSAIGFGLIGVILALILTKTDKLSGSAFIVSLFAFSFAVMIGVVWEIFEFSMDQTFGLRMQKSGLIDTMWDLIVDCLGAALGAGAGWAYLSGMRAVPLASTILDFVRKNPRFFKKQP